MCKYNRNNYVTLTNYDKDAPLVLKEKFTGSEYITQNTSYPYKVDEENSGLLKNYTSSGVVATNPAYKVGIEAPGICWS